MRCLKCGTPLVGGACPACPKSATRPLQNKGTKPFAGIFASKPSSADLLAEGMELFEKGQFEDAITPLEMALDLDPENFQLLALVGRTGTLLGEYARAEKHLMKAASIPQASPLYYLGDLYLRMGRLYDAERFLKQAIALPAAPIEAHLTLAKLFREQDRALEAQKAYEAALARDPSLGEARLGLARVLYKQGDHMRAMAQLHYAAAAGLPEAFALSGDIHQALGNDKQALLEYQKAMEQLSQDAELSEKLGKLHLKLGENRKALRWLRKAIQIDPSLHESSLVVAQQLESYLPQRALALYHQLQSDPDYLEAAEEALLRLEPMLEDASAE